jgi:hypothetical protein
MKGVAHNISAASWPTTSFFIPFSVLTGAKAGRLPRFKPLCYPRLPLKKPKTTINRCPIQKKPPYVAQRVQRAPSSSRPLQAFLPGCSRASGRGLIGTSGLRSV